MYPEARKQVKHSPAWLQLDHKCDRKTFHQLPLQICMCSAINKYLEHIQIRYKLTCLWTLIKTQNHRTISFQNQKRPQNSLDECTHPSQKHQKHMIYRQEHRHAWAWIRDREVHICRAVMHTLLQQPSFYPAKYQTSSGYKFWFFFHFCF